MYGTEGIPLDTSDIDKKKSPVYCHGHRCLKASLSNSLGSHPSPDMKRFHLKCIGEILGSVTLGGLSVAYESEKLPERHAILRHFHNVCRRAYGTRGPLVFDESKKGPAATASHTDCGAEMTGVRISPRPEIGYQEDDCNRFNPLTKLSFAFPFIASVILHEVVHTYQDKIMSQEHREFALDLDNFRNSYRYGAVSTNPGHPRETDALWSETVFARKVYQVLKPDAQLRLFN